MDELRVCQEEKEILKQKLHIHLDRWTLDKMRFEEMAAKAAREIGLKEAEKSYETALREMLLGSQKQELLVLKMKLDTALEDMELTQIKLSTLKSQLQEERKWHDSVKETMRGMKARFAKKLSWEKSKLVMETERKVKHLQKLLDDKAQSHKAEVEQIEGKHAVSITQLKEEIEHLVSRDADTKSQQLQRSRQREQLQSLTQERDYLRGELEKLNAHQKEIQAIKDDRDRLIAEKDRFISREQEMEELLKERDQQNAQPEDFISPGEDHELVKERNKLKHELDLFKAQRQEEVSALIRERDFVWNQFKNLGEDYEKRIKKLSEQSMQDRQEIERLKNKIKEANVGKNEMMVEITILKLEVKRVEDLAIQKQRALEAELQELHSNLERMKEEKQTLILISDALKKESLLLELLCAKGTLDWSYQEQNAGTVGDGVKEVPEVLNCGDGPTLDHEMIESQIDQATDAHRDEEKKSSPSVEDLRRENENLRRETENLKVLYAELEDNQRKRPQKPAKVTNKANHRDPISRNLKLELEAAATSCPADDSPLTEGHIRKQQNKPDNQKLGSGTNSIQRKSKSVSNKSAPEESRSSEQLKVSKRNTRRRKGMPANGKNPSGENAVVPSPKNLRPRTRIDYSDSHLNLLGTAEGKTGKAPVNKRRRFEDENFEPTQNHRPPLQALHHNRRSSTKSAGPTISPSKDPLPESSKKFVLSPTKTSKGMVNFFSAAFNVPKLKTPAHFMS